MNEVDLVKKAKLGDVKSFCALYDIYKKKLYNYAFFLTGQPSGCRRRCSRLCAYCF